MEKIYTMKELHNPCEKPLPHFPVIVFFKWDDGDDSNWEITNFEDNKRWWQEPFEYRMVGWQFCGDMLCGNIA